MTYIYASACCLCVRVNWIGVLRFAFTLIDPSSPSRLFSFAARIGANNEYIGNPTVRPSITARVLIVILNSIERHPINGYNIIGGQIES
jgi:hypothetical protein